MSDYSATFPPQRPVFNADFSNSSKIDPRATFTRASTGSYFGTAKHLASENLLTPSTPDASWTRARLSPTYSQTGPYTGANATLHTEQAITNTAYIGSANYVTVANTSYTYSVWVKQNTGSRNYYQLRVGGLGAGVPFVTYHLSGAGSIDEFGGSYLDSYSITAGPTGWYKLTMSITPTSASSSTYFFLCVGAPSGGELPNITGDTGNSFLVFGAQVSSTGESVLNETTTQIHREYAPTLQTAASGAARFEHSATDGQSMGLLVESQFTQHLLRTEEFDNASWSKSNATVQSNSAIAPSGELTADLLVESDDTVAASHFAKQSFTPASGVSYTYSFYAKAAGRTNVRIQGVFGGINGYAEVNLSTKAVSGATGSINNVTATDVGNGWVRVEAVLGPTTGTGGGDVYVWLNDGSGISYIGDGYSGVILWGANLTQSSHAYSYLKAEGAATTKAADSMSVTLSDIGQDPIGNAVSAVAEFDTNASDAQYRRVMVLRDGTTGLRIDAQAYSGNGYVFVANTSGGTTELTSKSGITTGFHKVAIGLDGTTANASFDGATAATMSNADTASVQFDTLQIGSYSATQLHLEGHIRNVSLYNVGLSATNVEALTS
jgi:hypothetical protein